MLSVRLKLTKGTETATLSRSTDGKNGSDGRELFSEVANEPRFTVRRRKGLTMLW